MTTELEEQFFKTFGIEPISKWHKCKDYSCVCCDEYDNCSKREFIYPEITDRILLKLICKVYCLMFSTQGTTIEILKEDILKEFIYWQEDVDKNEIQQLFKEEE